MTINHLKSNFIDNQDPLAEPGTPTYHVAIIGGGPKGLYGLERLLAQLKKASASVPIAIHLFNRTPYFGAGDIYRPDQPDFLIMNYPNVKINMWPENGPEPVVPEPLNFVNWLQTHRPEGADPKAYAKRSEVGTYLMDGFELLKKYCPDGVKIYTYPAEVSDIIPGAESFHLECKTDSGKKILGHDFQQILLTTGHPQVHSGIPDLIVDQADHQQLAGHLIDFIYPVEEKLSRIRSQENVVIKGLGLTFIDAVLALTEGRGGHFSGTPASGLTYHPSGREPHKIFPYSRSGLPMFPRLGESAISTAKLHFFRESALEKKFRDQDRIDFKTELLPLIEQEVVSRYYAVLFHQYGQELKITGEYAEVQSQIDDFHRTHPEEKHFSLDNLLGALPQPGMGLHQSFMFYLEEVLEAAKSGSLKSPLAAATAVWRDLSAIFNKYYSFGGLRPDAHREFLENYAGHFNRLAYGPPVVNLEKIRAIAEAGCLDFSFVRSPKLEFRPELDCFLLHHPCHALHTSAYYWVDARIPKVDLSREKSELYNNLLQRGLIRNYQNTDGKTTFCPGCMDLDREGHPRDQRGRSVTGLTAYGTPTEGITYDNDTLSRQRNDFASKWAENILEELVLYKATPAKTA